MKQTRQAVHAIKQSIYLDVYEWNSALLKDVNNCLNNNIYSNLETSGGQSSDPYLNVIHFFKASVN